ncbi:MAG: ADP-ribosylglycohydrolase family protein [Chloroflexota bacterium]|nr:ADP-ribosylglycohydrolase family protein [Chloroflexota bacterium]
MLGAIAGDIIGSVYERHQIKSKEFPLFHPSARFTDDTVLTIAVAYAILEGVDFVSALQPFGRRYPSAGYGETFYQWLFTTNPKPYNSWGNGSAMRVSPVGFAYKSIDRVLLEAKRSAQVSHNHPEGIKGAQATALAVHLGMTGREKDAIRNEMEGRFNYDLDRTVEDIRPTYRFDVSCQGSVPEAIIAFLDSTDYEDAVRNAVSLGGDSDTLACIAGGIAQAYYKHIPEEIIISARERLPGEFIEIIDRFEEIYL